MSTVNKYPIIQKIIAKMLPQELKFLDDVMNTKEHKDSTSFGALPENHDICMAVIQNQNYAPLTGILWNTRDDLLQQLDDDYYLIDLFTDGEYTRIYHIVDDKFTRIRETITLLEVRFWIAQATGGGGGGTTIIRLYNSGAHFTTSAEVQAFVSAKLPTYTEDEYGNVIVVEANEDTWKFDYVSREWKLSGVDIISPFTNSRDGSIRGYEQDGYVEHLTTDPNGAGHVHGWDKKLDKSTATVAMANAYVHSTGSDGLMPIDKAVSANSIVRRTASGQIKAADAQNAEEVITKGQHDTALLNLVPKISDTSIVYTMNSSGNFASIKYTSEDTVETIVYRDANGNFKAGNATAGKHVLNRDTADGRYLRLTEIVDSVVSTSLNQVAPLKTIKDLNDRINNLSAGGRYLSGWNCSTGLPQTNPGALPYTYRSGDYYIVSAVAAGTNYRPAGTTYDGNPSTVVEAGGPALNDYYRYDGSTWSLVKAAASIVEFSTISGDAMSNASLAAYFNSKMNTYNGSGTGTTVLENLIVRGDITFPSGSDFNCEGTADFSGVVTVETLTGASGQKEVVNKQYLEKHIKSGSGAPTSSTVGIKGQLYIDNTNGNVYRCASIDTTVTPNVYGWTNIGDSDNYAKLNVANTFTAVNTFKDYIEVISGGAEVEKTFYSNSGIMNYPDGTLGTKFTFPNISDNFAALLCDKTGVTLGSEQTITGKKTIKNDIVLPAWHNSGGLDPLFKWTDKIYFDKIYLSEKGPYNDLGIGTTQQLSLSTTYEDIIEGREVTNAIYFPYVNSTNNGKTLALAEDIAANYLSQVTADTRYLKLEGGQLTGSIVHPAVAGTPIIKGADDNTNYAIAYGGTGYNTGASLWLAGIGAGGGFGIDAYDGTNRASLVGNAANGELKWNNEKVLTQRASLPTLTLIDSSKWQLWSAVYSLGSNTYFMSITLKNISGSAQGSLDYPVVAISGIANDCCLSTACFEAPDTVIGAVIQTRTGGTDKVLKFRTNGAKIPNNAYIPVCGVFRWTAS